MSSERPVRTSSEIDPALLATHPELAVLTLDLPDSDGEPMENERARLQMLLIGICGNLPALHAHLVRLAEEIARLDVMSGGRIISGCCLFLGPGMFFMFVSVLLLMYDSSN